ncbi:MAG: 50S ribosomal protein L4 [Nitrospinaceae bacterium]|nr:MAG: 50S ribosomal protein L4 [Nitrospinaceae bacterium]
MPELDLLDANNKKVGTVEASSSVFEAEVKEHLVHQYVVHQLAARRGGNAATKSNKGELHGSGKKPWKQKGTGRARAGNSRSPIWRGGMTVFGPTPRDYGFKMSKKSKKLALKSILTDMVKDQRLAVVDKLTLENPKTSEAVQLLKNLNSSRKTLFLLADKNSNLELGVRNIPNVDVLLVDGLNVYDLAMHEKVFCTPQALKKIEERLA